jgi:hypothetical protein
MQHERNTGLSDWRSAADVSLGFEAQLFLAADKLRKNVEPSDYKHVPERRQMSSLRVGCQRERAATAKAHLTY